MSPVVGSNRKIVTTFFLLCFPISNCAQPKEEVTIRQAPECSLPTSAWDGGVGTETDESNTIPAGCEGVIMNKGVNPQCAVPTTGTLQLGDDQYQITHACYTQIEIAEVYPEIYGPAYFNGYFLTMVTDQGCEPMVGIYIADPERYGEVPFTVNLQEPLCESGARLASSLFVRDGDDCWRAIEGTILISRHTGKIYIDGWSEGIARLDEADEEIAVDLDFEMATRFPEVERGLMMDFVNLCQVEL